MLGRLLITDFIWTSPAGIWRLAWVASRLGLGLGMKYGMSEANYTSLGLTDGSFKGEDFFVGVSGHAYLAVNESIGDVRVGFQAWTTLNQSAESEAKEFIRLINNNVAFRDTFFNSMQIFITLGLNVAQI
ncbi:hypothetical protein MMH89_03690 [Candidatus Comchoanobacter bicostacola]|uniref:Uncharacterized protein n=1 Tax=Candidatus Comchoanobacter bicostacola TaxID=2919598 RepID=A0ABY5DK13_9GAMM|nr:hypothetical protein [Candidatus Comchoanobacter bicostacola]UTC24323.1 hypothetical protein MMH89_03690 [Candidatus Comchoanobacter bicostacola]